MSKPRKTFLGVILLVAVLLTGFAYRAGIACTLGSTQNPYDASYDQPPAPYAVNEMQSIIGIMCPGGCGNVTLVMNPTVQNARVESFRPGLTKIAYNPRFMNQIYHQIGPAASFGIMAHELGHHIDSFNSMNWMDHSWGRELRADAVAGCALARARLNAAQMEASLRAIAQYPSPSHPAWPDRVVALRTGYNQCGGVGYSWN